MSFFDERGVVAIKLPISAFNRKFFLVLRFAHIDTVVDARRVANDKGRSVIRFCLGNCLDELRFVRAHGAFCDVNVFVSHGDFAKVFLLCEFAACREFCDRARRGGFTCLSAGVAVNFGVENEDIYVFARRDNVIESYAQPSPPKIHTDFLIRQSSRLRISSIRASASALAPFCAVMTFTSSAAVRLLPSASFMLLIQLSQASLQSALSLRTRASCATRSFSSLRLYL